MIPFTDTNFNQKTASGIPIYYVVQPADGLLKVSNLNRKVSTTLLKKWNHLSAESINTGDKLIVGFLNSKGFLR